MSEIVVFWIVRDTTCAECGEELGKGRFLRLEGERPLCLGCADLDHLVFLGRGDAALTAKELQANPVELAVRAHIRHQHTRYDELLGQGTSRHEARALVATAVEKRMEEWRRGR